MNWIITPDKFLTEEEVQNFRKSCRDAAGFKHVVTINTCELPKIAAV